MNPGECPENTEEYNTLIHSVSYATEHINKEKENKNGRKHTGSKF